MEKFAAASAKFNSVYAEVSDGDDDGDDGDEDIVVVVMIILWS